MRDVVDNVLKHPNTSQAHSCTEIDATTVLHLSAIISRSFLCGNRYSLCSETTNTCLVPAEVLDGGAELLNVIHANRGNPCYSRIREHVYCIITPSIVGCIYGCLDSFFIGDMHEPQCQMLEISRLLHELGISLASRRPQHLPNLDIVVGDDIF